MGSAQASGASYGKGVAPNTVVSGGSPESDVHGRSCAALSCCLLQRIDASLQTLLPGCNRSWMHMHFFAASDLYLMSQINRISKPASDLPEVLG